ncbi:hypothetical protein HPB52_000540 [Rhipicephalus sanguineus]|uniref:Uncharacterized protein n=1 Tax=Rhipicephalus sanguineus TaxID=34632 RepID=A0A9D4SV91_RHISA|nr:hypothetical protein HPB52_000540 [Rhipicephalus sanguineus]
MTLGVRQVGATVVIAAGPVRLALTGDPSNGPSQCATRAFRIPRTDAATTGRDDEARPTSVLRGLDGSRS